MTTSAVGRFSVGCTPTGMPRPLSSTETEPSKWIVTSTRSQKPGQRLVDRVVDDLVDHVVQPGAVIGVADVHAGALAHRLEALEDLDALFVVRASAGGRFGASSWIRLDHIALWQAHLEGTTFKGANWLQT